MNNGIDNRDIFTYNLLQLVVFIIILGLIIVRGINYKTVDNSWIWIINYIGMSIAFINLFVNKCFSLKYKNSNKYKPFVGFTVIMVIVIIILFIPVKKWQSSSYVQATNDLITLFALFFSLSHTIWDSLLNILVKFLKR